VVVGALRVHAGLQHERGALPVQPDAFGQVLQLVRADVSLESGYT